MNIPDAAAIAKDAVRIVSTAGLSKDVIDLLEKKLALLTDELALANSENAKLKAEIEELRKKQAAARPADTFDVDAGRILRLMFDHADEISMEEVAARLSLPMGQVQYHFDVLAQRRFLRCTSGAMHMQFARTPAKYGLLPAGRAFVMKEMA